MHSVVGRLSSAGCICCTHSRCGKLSGRLPQSADVESRRVTTASVCLQCGTLDVDLLTTHFYRKMTRSVARALVDMTEALAAPWTWYHLIDVFSPLKLLPRLLRRIEAKGIPVILVTQDCPRGCPSGKIFCLPPCLSHCWL